MLKKQISSTLIIIIVLCMTAKVLASSFDCNDPSQGIEIPNSESIDTISAGCLSKNWNFGSKKKHLIPKMTNWHIYAIPNGEKAKYSCYPEGFVEPRITSGGSTLELVANANRLKELGYSNGDKIETSINVYLPLNQLRTINLDGVDQDMEVIVTESALQTTNNDNNDNITFPTIRIHSSGVDTRIYVTAPYSPILYSGSGVDNQATIQAGRNSSIDLSGVDQSLHIQSEFIVGTIRLSGVDNQLYLEGDYNTMALSGVDCEVYVIGGETGCNAVENSGVGNNCRISKETNTTVVPTLSCLASTKIIQGSSNGAIIGASFGLLAIIGLCTACCIYSCGGRRRHQEVETTKHIFQPPPPSETAPYIPQQAGVVEAEVIGIESSIHDDPELAQTSSAKVF